MPCAQWNATASVDASRRLIGRARSPAVALRRLFRLTGKRRGSSHVLTAARGIASFHSSEVYDSRAVTPACDTVQRTRREDDLAAVQEVLRQRGAGLAPARRTAGGRREEGCSGDQARRREGSEGRSRMTRGRRRRRASRRARRGHRAVWPTAAAQRINSRATTSFQL